MAISKRELFRHQYRNNRFMCLNKYYSSALIRIVIISGLIRVHQRLLPRL